LRNTAGRVSQLPALLDSRLGRALVLRVEVLLERGTEVLVLALARRGRTVAQHSLFYRVDRLLRVGLGIVRNLGIIRIRPRLIVCAFVTGHGSPFIGKFSNGGHAGQRREREQRRRLPHMPAPQS
jgi:hypothetical protein